MLRHELQPGERVVGSAKVTTYPSRWVSAAFLALAIALSALRLFSVPVPGPLAAGIGAPLLLGLLYFPHPVLVMVTDQRLICLRLSWFREAPRRLVFAVSLAEVRVVKYRPGEYVSSIQCEIPGGKRTWLTNSRAGRKDFARVEEALARSGAFTKLEPPRPAAANS